MIRDDGMALDRVVNVAATVRMLGSGTMDTLTVAAGWTASPDRVAEVCEALADR